MVVDPLLLIISLIIVALLIVGNIYFLAYYSHYADTEFGQSILVKLVLVSNYYTNSYSRFSGTCSPSVRCS